PTWLRPTRIPEETPSCEQLLARVEQHADRPRMRERVERALRAEAVGLEVALRRHAALRAEVAVEPRDELAEALEVLERARAVRLAELQHLGQAREAEGVQVLVRRRCL